MADINFNFGTEDLKKFEKLLNNLNKIAKDLKKTVGQIGKVTEDDATRAKKLVVEAKKLENAMKRQEMATKGIADRQDRINQKQRESKGIIGSLESEVRKLRSAYKSANTELEKRAAEKQLKKVNQQLTKAKGTTASWGKALGSFQFKFNALGNVAANVASSISRNFKRALKESLKVIIDFNAAIKDLEAISGATGKQLSLLKNTALLLGATTKFTAAEVAGLQKEFAKLGFTIPEILAAQEATLSLAAATGEDLAMAAEVAGATIRGFGYNASQTLRIVDVMAKSFSSSALDMTRFAESMKHVAPVARKAGLTIERTTSLLAQMADAGIHGSRAGTALRRILVEIDKTGESVSERLKTLAERGLSLADAEDEVGKRAQTALLILADQVDTLDSLTKSFENSAGAAKKMADVQLDTIAGDLKILTSAWQGFILGIDAGEGVISKLIRTGVSGLTNVLNDLTPAVESQAIQMRALYSEMDRDLVILENNVEQNEFRSRLIDEINVKYKDYLPNLISEKDTLKEINKATEEARKNLMGKILIMEMESEIKEAVSSFRLMFDLAFNAKKDAALSWSEFLKKYYNVDDAGDLPSTFAKQAKKHFDSLDNRMLESSEVLSKTISDIREKFSAIGESFGFNFGDMFAGADDVTKAFENINFKAKDHLDIMDRIAAEYERIANLDPFADIDFDLPDEIFAKEDAATDALTQGFLDKETEKQKAIRETFRVARSLSNSFADIFESNKQKELSAVGDNAEKRLEIEKDYAKKQQLISISQALISGAQAIATVWETWAWNPPVAWGLSALAALQVGTQVAVIKSQKFAKGGEIGGLLHSQGGTQVEAERGEYIINRASTSKYKDLIEGINENDQLKILSSLDKDKKLPVIKPDPYMKKMYEFMVSQETYGETKEFYVMNKGNRKVMSRK